MAKWVASLAHGLSRGKRHAHVHQICSESRLLKSQLIQNKRGRYI